MPVLAILTRDLYTCIRDAQLPPRLDTSVTRIYVSLDLETTGLDPEHDRIIEVGALRFRGDRVLGQSQHPHSLSGATSDGH